MSGWGSGVWKIIRATYNFFVGDMIILLVVLTAFIVTWLIVHFTSGATGQVVGGALFVILILVAVGLTLGRERAGARKQARTGQES